MCLDFLSLGALGVVYVWASFISGFYFFYLFLSKLNIPIFLFIGDLPFKFFSICLEFIYGDYGSLGFFDKVGTIIGFLGGGGGNGNGLTYGFILIGTT